MSNLIAALGALLIVIAVFGLAGGWWSLIAAGVFLLVSSYALHTQATAVAAKPAGKLASVKKAA